MTVLIICATIVILALIIAFSGHADRRRIEAHELAKARLEATTTQATSLDEVRKKELEVQRLSIQTGRPL